jgi:beta-lactamase superfamily II metal-dependent hydrolase
MEAQVFDGIEVDMLSLGDADCILVTHWTNNGPGRVLIDGGCASDAGTVLEFLRSRNATALYSVVCTHPHNDHASGLIKLVKDKSICFCTAWMHDLTKHASTDALRRAVSANSSEAQGVKEVLETTKELASAFASHTFYGRSITPQEPFAGQTISNFPSLTVLGPTQIFYKNALEEFIKEELPSHTFLSALLAATPAAGLNVPVPTSGWRSALSGPPFPMSTLSSLIGSPAIPPPPTSTTFAPDMSSLLSGLLKNSSVEKSPKTQPFNNTSVILGMQYMGQKLLFTADAGAETLDAVPPHWKNLKWMQVPHHGSEGNLSQTNIERFCPEYAYISACGDTSHPNSAIVNGFIKVRTAVFSTHKGNPGHLWFHLGNVPQRIGCGYSAAIPLKGNAEPVPLAALFRPWAGTR